MMGGVSARFGFRYQDKAAIWLWLREIAATAIPYGAAGDVTEVAVEHLNPEAPTGASLGWDIAIKFSSGIRRLYEAKSGEVESDEKQRLFWTRVRQYAQGSANLLFVGWILDPERSGPFAKKLEDLRTRADDLKAIGVPSAQPESPVTDWQSLGSYALYWMCSPNEGKNGPALALDDAIRLLRRMDILCLKADLLDARLDSLLGAVFPTSFPEDAFAAVRDRLEQAALNGKSAECGALLDLASAAVKKADFAEVAHVINEGAEQAKAMIATGPQTNQVAYQETAQITSLFGLLQEPTSGLIVVTGHAGVGKSVAVQTTMQSFAALRNDAASSASGHPCGNTGVLYYTASYLASEGGGHFGARQADALLRGVRLMAAEGGGLVVVDGLDRVNSAEARDLTETLAAMRACPGVRIIASCRTESWWSKEAFSEVRDAAWQNVELLPWDKGRVHQVLSKALGEKTASAISAELMDILTTPFFLDIFLQLCHDRQDDLDAVIHARTRFDLLRRYKAHRIDASHGGEECSAEEKRACVRYLCDGVLAGTVTFDPNDADASLKALNGQGVLRKTFGNRLVLRHALLWDFLVADQLLGIMVRSGEGTVEAWRRLAACPDDRLRAGIVEMILGTAFSSSYRDEATLGCRWIRHAGTTSAADISSGIQLRASTVRAWAQNRPSAVPYCCPVCWPPELGLPSQELLCQLVEHVRARLVRDLWPPVLDWWNAFLSHLEAPRHITSPKLLAELIQLAEVIFRGDEKGKFISAADRNSAGEILLHWSQTSDFRREEGIWGLLVEWTCKLLTEIPAEWLLEEAHTQNVWAKKTAIEHLAKVRPPEKLGEIVLAAFEMSRSESERHRPWVFSEVVEKARDHLLEYPLDTVCASTAGLIEERPHELFSAIAAYVDAVCNVKHLYAQRSPIRSLLPDSEEASGVQREELFRTGDLTDDLSSVWFWANDQHPDVHHKLCTAILRVLAKAAAAEEGTEFLKLRDQLFEASNLIIFRTLVAEALYRQRNHVQPWHVHAWADLLTDRRLYQSGSMFFWTGWGLRTWFTGLAPEAQDRVVDNIRRSCESGVSERVRAFYVKQIEKKTVEHSEGPDLLAALASVEKAGESYNAPHPRDSRLFGVTAAFDHARDVRYMMEDWSCEADVVHFRALDEITTSLRQFPERMGKLKDVSSRDVAVHEIFAVLEKSVEPLNTLFADGKNVADLKCGYPLGYAGTVIKCLWYCCGLDQVPVWDAVPETEASRLRDRWFGLLNRYAPWRELAMARTEQTLSELQPDADWCKHEMGGAYGWPDPLICAIELWDGLAVPPQETPVSQWEQRLVSILSEHGAAMPWRLRHFFTVCLRPYHWARMRPEARRLLWDWIEESEKAEFLTWAFPLCWNVFPQNRADLVECILNKQTLEGRVNEICHYDLGPMLAWAWYRRDQVAVDEQTRKARGLAEKVLAGGHPRWAAEGLIGSFTQGLANAFDHGLEDKPPFVDVDGYITGLERVWVLTAGANRESKSGTGRETSGVVHVIGETLDMKSLTSLNLRREMWARMTPLIVRIAHETTIDGLTWLVFALRPRGRLSARLPGTPPDWGMFMPVLAELFLRVRHFRDENVTTGDLGYAGATSGYDLVELVRETAEYLGGYPQDRDERNRLDEIIAGLSNLGAPGAASLYAAFSGR